LFARLDANGDGSISRAEFDARPERGPARQERRGNRMERRGERGGMMGAGFGARMFERADADKDGRISIAEATARPLAMFDRADANKDGTVTLEERRAAWQAVRAQRQARPNG
jgi:Ca2+-binding EF-hand superfamily protein